MNALNSPAEITAATRAAALRKATMPLSRLITLSILAGAYIALGGALSIIAGFGFPEVTTQNPALQRLLSGATFPIGLILVVVLGAELFTGNNAVMMPAVLSRKCTILQVLRNWTIVWLGNFAGALLFILLLVIATGLLESTPYREATIAIAATKVSLPWSTVFFRAIGANWCVCLALWLALAGNGLLEKMAGCWLPVMAFVALGFEHSIANMFFIPAGISLGADISLSDMFLCNLIPATLGNILGGALFVGCIYGKLHPHD